MTDEVPDTDVLLTDRLVKLVIFAERAVTLLTDRLTELESQLNGRVHERELLARAAALIDPDSDTPPELITYEQRLDWLAKWREVVS